MGHSYCLYWRVLASTLQGYCGQRWHDWHNIRWRSVQIRRGGARRTGVKGAGQYRLVEKWTELSEWTKPTRCSWCCSGFGGRSLFGIMATLEHLTCPRMHSRLSAATTCVHPNGLVDTVINSNAAADQHRSQARVRTTTAGQTAHSGVWT